MALEYLKNERNLSVRGSILLTDGSTHPIDANNVVRYAIDEASTAGESITLGDARAADFTLEIEDAAHVLTAGLLINARVTVEIGLDGVFSPMGQWYVDGAQISRQSATVSLSGSDALGSKMGGLYVDGLYPATLGQIAQRAAEQAGLTLKSADFRNANIVVAAQPEWDAETNTQRAVIGYIAGCAGGFARIDRSGALEIVPYNMTDAETITADYFTTLSVGGGRSFAFNCLQVAYFGTNVYVRYALDSNRTDTAGDTLRISDNPLMTEQIAQTLLAALTGLTSSAVVVDWVGDPAMQPGMRVTVRDTDGSEHTGVVTRQMISVDGGLHAQTSADLPINIESTFADDTLFTPAGRVNIQAVEGRLKVWAENEISLAVGGKADQSDLEDALAQIEVLDGEIGLRVTESQLQDAVGGISVGGRNLLLDSEAENVIKLAIKNYDLSAYGIEKLGQGATTVVFSFDAKADAEVSIDHYARKPTGQGTMASQAVPTRISTEWARYSQVYTYPAGTYPQFSVRSSVSVNGGGGSNDISVYLRNARLEIGSLPTDWTAAPEDTEGEIETLRTELSLVPGKITAEVSGALAEYTPTEVIDGSRLVITKDNVHIDTPVFEVNVSGEAGDAYFGANGLAVDQINSPSVYARYDGPTSLSVGGVVDGEKVFATLSDAFARLNGKHIPSRVSISMTVDTVENPTLGQTTGHSIVILGNDHKISGGITLLDVPNRVYVYNLKVSQGAAGEDCINASNCANIALETCEFTANSYESGYGVGLQAISSQVSANACTFYNGYAAVFADTNSRVFVQACLGEQNKYAIYARNNASVGILTSRPNGDTGVFSRADSVVRGATGTPGSGSGTIVTPTVTTTATLLLTNSRTHYGSGWYSGTNVIAQGKTDDGGVYKGCMWFDASAISGKTILAATLKLYRNAGVGSGNNVTVRIGTMTNTGPSGGVATVTANDVVVGTVGQKEWLSVSTAEIVEAVRELASGAANGLYIWGPAASYAQFAGYGSANAPTLEVTYQ